MKKLLFLFILLFLNNQLYSQCWDKVSNGQNHTIAIKTAGTLWAWGANLFGELGNGNNTDRNFPIQIGSSNDWKDIFGGIRVSAAIKNNFTLWGWGLNAYNNQLGQPSIISDIIVPT